MSSITQAQSNVQLWQQPPPAGFNIPTIPPVVSTRTLTVKEYEEKIKTNSKDIQKLSKSKELRRTILFEIEKRPQLWAEKKSFAMQKKLWPAVACDVYKRTGIILNIQSLRRVFKSTKTNLRGHLAKAIFEFNLEGMEMEEFLWKNAEMYGSIRFYRTSTQKLEQEYRNKRLSNQGSTVDIDDKDEEDLDDSTNDCEIIGFVQADPTYYAVPYKKEPIQMEETEQVMDNSASSTTTSSNEAMIQPNSVHDRPPSDFIDNFEIPRNSLIDRYIDEQRRNRRTEADIEAEYMRRRIGNFEVEQPTRIKLLQNTLLQVAMAVERNSYAHISNVFEDLSRMFDN